MVKKWVSGAVRSRLLVLVAAATLAVLGAISAKSASTDALPEFSPPYVEVQTDALGLSAEEVEQLITAPMENLLLNGVAFLDGIRSQSVNGLSSITLIFEPGTDPLVARQVVQERLTQAKLLAHLTDPPAILQPMSSASRVLVVGLKSEEVKPIDMSVLARWTIRPKLLGVPGVANVSIFGQRERQLHVEVDPRKLAQHKVTLQEVIATSGNALWVSPLSYLNASAPGTGGFVDTLTTRLEVRHVSPITTPEDLGKIVIERADRSKTDPALTLADIGTVVEDHQPLIGDAVVDDGPGLVLVIEKLPGANTVEVTQGIEEALKTLAPGLKGVTADTTLFRPASFVEAARANLGLALGIGIALAALVMLLLLSGWRLAATAVLSAVATILITVFALERLHIALDAMTLAGLVLAVAVVIHETVLDADHLGRRLGRRADGDASRVSIFRTILDATVDLRRSMGYAAAITLLACAPLLFADRLSAAFLRPAVTSFVVAIVISFLASLTLTPALAAVAVRVGAGAPDSEAALAGPEMESSVRRGVAATGVTAALTRLSSGVGRAALKARPLVLGALALGAIAALAGVPFLGRSSVLPEFRESQVVVAWHGAPGASRTAMTDVATELGEALRKIPGVANVGGHVGRAVLSDQVSGVGRGELWVTVDAAADRDAVAAQVREAVGGYSKVTAEVRSYYGDRVEAIGGLLSPYDRGRVATKDNEVVVRIYGEDLTTLNTQAALISKGLTGVGGVSAVRVDEPLAEPNLRVTVDLAAAEKHGLKPGDIRRAAATMVNGLKVGSLFEDQKVFDVVVTGSKEFVASPEAVAGMLIDTPSGTPVRLDAVADVERSTSLSVINRDSVSRRLDVVATVNGDRAAAIRGIEANLATVQFPLEYHAEVIDDVVDRQGDSRRVLLAALAALILALILVQIAVGGWFLGALALTAILFAASGGVAVTALLGGLTVGTVLGLLGALAIGARGVLATVRHLHRVRLESSAVDDDRLVSGLADRGAGALTAALVTAAAMAPVAILGRGAGLEIVGPMALVVLGGLLTTLIAELAICPVIHRVGARREEHLVVTDDDVLGDPSPALAG